jgi:hypothetical protein
VKNRPKTTKNRPKSCPTEISPNLVALLDRHACFTFTLRLRERRVTWVTLKFRPSRQVCRPSHVSFCLKNWANDVGEGYNLPIRRRCNISHFWEKNVMHWEHCVLVSSNEETSQLVKCLE